MDAAKYVPVDEPFYLKRDHHDIVSTATTLAELATGVKNADDNVIRFHLRDHKNDFARWIQISICNPILAYYTHNIAWHNEPAIFREKFLALILNRKKYTFDEIYDQLDELSIFISKKKTTKPTPHIDKELATRVSKLEWLVSNIQPTSIDAKKISTIFANIQKVEAAIQEELAVLHRRMDNLSQLAIMEHELEEHVGLIDNKMERLETKLQVIADERDPDEIYKRLVAMLSDLSEKLNTCTERTTELEHQISALPGIEQHINNMQYQITTAQMTGRKLHAMIQKLEQKLVKHMAAGHEAFLDFLYKRKKTFSF